MVPDSFENSFGPYTLLAKLYTGITRVIDRITNWFVWLKMNLRALSHSVYLVRRALFAILVSVPLITVTKTNTVDTRER